MTAAEMQNLHTSSFERKSRHTQGYEVCSWRNSNAECRPKYHHHDRTKEFKSSGLHRQSSAKARKGQLGFLQLQLVPKLSTGRKGRKKAKRGTGIVHVFQDLPSIFSLTSNTGKLGWGKVWYNRIAPICGTRSAI